MCVVSMSEQNIIFFHRNKTAGYSIDKVTQTVIRQIENKTESFLPKVGASIRAIIGNLWFVLKHRDKRCINHITGDVHYAMLGLIGCKSVLTIHDTVSLDFAKHGIIKRLLLEYLWFRIPLRIATKVVCISEETKKCVERYTKRRDIVVIHNAIDPIFKKVDADLNRKPKRILIIGTNPNKNLERTFESVKDLGCELTIIGKLNEEQMSLLQEYQIQYNVKTGLTDQQIVEEYIKTDIVSFVSLFEGFGMIVIEANKVGRPVITSDIPVMREVAGDAALFVNPTDIVDMLNGFKTLFEDAELRQSLVNEGYKNAKRFDVDIILKQWESLYNSF